MWAHTPPPSSNAACTPHPTHEPVRFALIRLLCFDLTLINLPSYRLPVPGQSATTNLKARSFIHVCESKLVVLAIQSQRSHHTRADLIPAHAQVRVGGEMTHKAIT